MEIPVKSYKKVVATWWVLRIFYGVMPLLAGLDKLLALNSLAQWSGYVGSFVQQMVPLELVSLVRAAGIVEILIGLLILAGLTRIGGWLLYFWFLLIAANLISMGVFYDIAARDILIAIGALVLVWVTDIKEEVEA